MNPSSLLTAVVLGLGTIACQMTTTSESRAVGADGESPTTGLEGRTMITAPCPDQPVSASFEVLDVQDKVVARFESDAEGHFSIALQPGVYTIAPAVDAPLIIRQTTHQIRKTIRNQLTRLRRRAAR